jgi:SAM-dependent methyltransferase
MLIDPPSVGIKISDKQKKYIENIKELDFFKFSDVNDCYACGGNEFTVVANKDRYGFDLNYCLCDKCGFLFANPYYTQDSLSEFYGEHYAHIYGRAGSEQKVFEDGYVNTTLKVLPMLTPYMPKIGSVMDFGCGYGGALASFPASWIRVGFDYDEFQLAYGRKFDLDLRNINMLEACDRLFDVIMLNQVLEHVPDPVSLLKKLKKYLKPNGVIYLEVPGFQSILDGRADPRLAFKNAHRHFFCLDSLCKIANYADLKLVNGDERVMAIFSSKENTTLNALDDINFKKSAVWFDSMLEFRPHLFSTRMDIFSRMLHKIKKIVAMSKFKYFYNLKTKLRFLQYLIK